MKTIKLNFSGIETIDALHPYLKKELGFPEHYGGNLDALYDSLMGDIEFPTKIMISGFAKFEQKVGKEAKSVIKVFQDASKDTDQIQIELI